jgi:hypothetical protein
MKTWANDPSRHFSKDTISHQGSANQNYNEISFHLSWNRYYQKIKIVIHTGKDVERKELSPMLVA